MKRNKSNGVPKASFGILVIGNSDRQGLNSALLHVRVYRPPFTINFSRGGGNLAVLGNPHILPVDLMGAAGASQINCEEWTFFGQEEQERVSGVTPGADFLAVNCIVVPDAGNLNVSRSSPLARAQFGGQKELLPVELPLAREIDRAVLLEVPG